MLDFIGDRVDDHYVNVEAFHIHGAVDLAALRKAVSSVLDRHDMLRSVYPPGADHYRILPYGEHLVDRILHVGHGPADRADAVAAGVDRVGRPMRLDSEPPLRIWFDRIDTEQAVLVVAGHYLVFDAWSLTLLYEELAAAYRRARSGTAEPPRPVQYHELERGLPADGLAGWTDLFDRPYRRSRELSRRVRTPLGPASAIRRSWDTTPGAVEQAARAYRLTPYVVGAAAMLRALSDTSGDPQVIIGCAFAGRTTAESATVIGFLATTIFLGADLGRVAGTGDLLHHLNGQLRRWYTHPRVEWQSLLEHYAAADAYVAKFAFLPDQFARPTPALDGTSTQRLPTSAGAALRRPIDLLASYGQSRVTAALTYRSDALTAAKAERLLGRFAVRLREIGPAAA
jgi:hypothetical protein